MLEKNPILNSISSWFSRTFADPEAVSLFFTLVFGILFIELLGHILMPVLISVVLTYLLNSIVNFLKRWRCPHLLAVLVVYILFVGLFIYAFLVLMPLLFKQLTNLINELPLAFTKSQDWVNQLMHNYPNIFSEKFFSDIQLENIIGFLKNQSAKIGQIALQYSLATIPSVIQVILYVVLVPLLVFFFLKDNKPIIQWLSQYLPSKKTLVQKVWSEVNDKIGCYVRSRVVEVILVGLVTSIVFSLLGLQYAILLGSLVGLSVIIPYIGAVVVTIPVVIIALMEWGFSAHFSYLMIAYATIIILDGNLLVPLLFAGSMDLHPVVIILSVVVFGAFWGFWGIFFAIPLATLVSAVLSAWPTAQAVVEE